MERKKRSKGSVWEFGYANKIFGTFGVEMRAWGQKLVKFCTLTHTHTTAAKLVVRMEAFIKRRSLGKTTCSKPLQFCKCSHQVNESYYRGKFDYMIHSVKYCIDEYNSLPWWLRLGAEQWLPLRLGWPWSHPAHCKQSKDMSDSADSFTY